MAKIIPGYTIDQTRADSILYEPGFIPRPTDQRLSFSMFFKTRCQMIGIQKK